MAFSGFFSSVMLCIANCKAAQVSQETYLIVKAAAIGFVTDGLSAKLGLADRPIIKDKSS